MIAALQTLDTPFPRAIIHLDCLFFFCSFFLTDINPKQKQAIDLDRRDSGLTQG